MRKLLSILITLLILLSVQTSLPAFAQTNFPNLSQSQVQELIEIKYTLNTLDDLQSRGVLNADVAKSQRNYYLTQAESLIGKSLTAKELTALLEYYSSSLPVKTQGTWQRVTGFFSFVNIIWVFSSILLVIAIGWLISLYLLPILFSIPARVYEVLIYLACVTSIIGGQTFAQGTAEFIALPGCLGLIGALAFTHYLHQSAAGKFYTLYQIDVFSFNSLILFLIWAGVAITYNSALIAFIAVIALETFFGFSVLVMPLCYCIGFRERGVIPSTTAASFFLLVFYVALRINQTNLPYLEIFSTGAFFLGTFVYFIGLLLLSSKWHGHKNVWHYLGLQLLTIVSGVLAIFIGSVWQIPQLEGIGGTFFFLYLIEKYGELPWQKQSWAWATLGLAIMLYLLSLVIKQYPQYFLFGS
jgi:hypothetical protein